MAVIAFTIIINLIYHAFRAPIDSSGQSEDLFSLLPLRRHIAGIRKNNPFRKAGPRINPHAAPGLATLGCTNMTARTMYRKIWEYHLVRQAPGEPSLIFIDRHLVHEVTSPQAFAGLKAAGRKVRRPDLTFA